MIKNIYDKDNKEYFHKYYCDNCFTEIIGGEILRHELAIRRLKFDLCSKCYREIDKDGTNAIK